MQPAGYLCQQGLVVEEDLPGPGNTVYVFDYGCLLEHEGATVWVRKGLLPLMEKVTYLPSEPILHDYRIERIREGDRLRLLLMTADVVYDARTDESEVVLLDHEARVKRFDAR